MYTKTSNALLLSGSLAFCSGLSAQTGQLPAILAGHAVLPANASMAAPADAPADLQQSGKYITGQRVEKTGSVAVESDGRLTGFSLPMRGQPRQGHSGIRYMPDGSYWVLSDNGFGTRENSPDAMLYLSQYQIDFESGEVHPQRVVFLHDPDRNVPFRIAGESSEKRYLTGADFDPESFQFAAGALWIGDEFGPYLIKADLDGRVLQVFETEVGGRVVKSPEHSQMKLPGTPDGRPDFQVARSRGLEGMAVSPDGRMLYPMLEAALWQDGQPENVAGRHYARVLEFDLEKQAWSGRSWQYVFEENGNAIGDFNMIDASHALVIERDNGEGTADLACAENASGSDCFRNVAKFKRVYRIHFSDANAGQPVEKQAWIDLMQIRDPGGLARKPLNDGVLTFPFMTIENVDVVDEHHIVVGNDNNFPFSASRHPNQADDNEFVLLEVGDLLKTAGPMAH